MFDTGGEFSVVLATAFAIFLVISLCVLIILWIAMPFSVFGIKDLMREAIEEQKKTNQLLKALVKRDVEGEAEKPPEEEKEEDVLRIE